MTAPEKGAAVPAARPPVPADPATAESVSSETGAPRRAYPLLRFLPFVATLVYVAAVLLAADTSPLDLVKYALYVGLALTLPGTLVYRALRRTPHSLLDDLAMGTAVGLVLELPAWTLVSVLDVRGLLWAWPLIVVALFAGIPRLRRHFRPRYTKTAPLGFSWAVGGAVAFFTTYLSSTFLQRNPILPTGEDTRQYLDLAYQLSLAGEAKHQFPLHVPQVAGEPLFYHWFGYAHMASSSMIGGIDLPVIALRLAIPFLCALAIVLTAVVGWRISGRALVGAVAAALFFVVGETNFTDPVTMPFGTQSSFVIWHGMSMIYSWVLLLALIGVVCALLTGQLARGGFVLAFLFLVASSGAKASSLPVVAVALLVTFVVVLLAQRRIPWTLLTLGVLTGAAQLFAMAVLFRFQAYGVTPEPMWSFERFWTPPDGPMWLAVLPVWFAFLVNMQLRAAGIVPLVWLRRGRLEPTQVFLLAGGIGGPLIYLMVKQPGDGNQYFTRAGFTFAVLLSAWGYAMVYDRAKLSRAGRIFLGVEALALAVVLVLTQFELAGPAQASVPPSPLDPLMPLLRWALVLAALVLLLAALWPALSRWRPALRGRGGIVALTAILVVGAPGLIMDMRKSERFSNGGAYATISLPRSRVEAARWLRDHSAPSDVVATNAHCINAPTDGYCDPRSFWLSAYAERRVLVEGWAFAPRVSESGSWEFWDPDLLARNDAAFTAPTAQSLSALRSDDGVRWLVADRQVGPESPDLAGLADLRYSNDRMAVYELR
ncbi:hypothetical protein SAMN05421812_10544 [Asanoa hainanensis]|uniref:4-amino-4-deoxy-L-arabinose transferase n=1 Tax=Asanoa hainanensis TaxID=560556 RepID=A0A239M1M1_9ACTN|nr:hypothetical protein [Asanoa hainanensis]SNT36525.1 hypothetical protein SAMN05421812_10544 [Asanoa hainanensis]